MDFLKVTSSPHMRHEDTTRLIMLDVIIALCPALVWAVYLFGARALTLTAVSVGSAVLFAASLQLAAALPGLQPMESEENPNPLKSALTKMPFAADEKMAWFVPQGDGLGIELDWDAVEKLTVK